MIYVAEPVRETLGGIEASNTQIILGLIAVLATCVGILGYVIKNSSTAKQALEQTTQVNRAVNNVGPGEHRLYDKISGLESSVNKLVEIQEKFSEHGWETLPPDLNTAVGLTVSIRELQTNYHVVNSKLDEILVNLQDHVEWEMQAKYNHTED